MTVRAQTPYPDRLETARLILRAPDHGDVDALARLANNRAIHAMTAALPYPYERDHAIAFVEEIARSGEEWAYAVALHDGTLVGVMGLHTGQTPCEIGYWIGEPHWRKGYASEAAAALAEAALRVTPVLHARARAENLASRAVLEKSGFEAIGEAADDCGPHAGVAVITYRRQREGATQ